MLTWIMILFCCLLAFYAAEYLAVRLPRIDSSLDRKPFNCRPCLTFHLTGILITCLALLVASCQVFFTGIVAASVVFVLAKYSDNKKITK